MLDVLRPNAGRAASGGSFGSVLVPCSRTIDAMTEGEVYARIGADGFARLVAGFYRRIATDDILGPMYRESVGDDLSVAEWRLREFLIGRFGGPMTYVETRGHPRLRMRHGPFKVDEDGARRWLTLMRESMSEAKLGDDVDALLWPYFRSTAIQMINHDGSPPVRATP